jgi:hypothetical protein
MRLTYETGIATLIQFIVLGILNIATALQSIVTTCKPNSGGDCVGNLLTSLVFYILIVIWFGVLLAIGYTAQQRRSKRLALLLIACEGAALLVASANILLNLKSFSGPLNFITSCADVLLSLWVILLAYRLTKVKRGRIVKKKYQSKDLQD